jgi:ESAT-6 family protein
VHPAIPADGDPSREAAADTVATREGNDMSSSFGVDTDAMASSAGKVAVAAEHIDALLTKMRTDINEMLGGWSGNGANAHKDLHERYENDVRTINTTLREIHEALLQTHRTYTHQENAQRSDHVVMRNQMG